jgi:integrase/recombinase XerC
MGDVRFFFKWMETVNEKKMDLKKISAMDLRTFRQELVNIKRQKTASVNRRIQSLKRFFTWATQAKLIKQDPTTDLRFMRRKPSTKPNCLAKNEVHALLRVAGQSSHGLAKRNYAILQIMLQAGLRVGEIVKLQYHDMTVKERSGVVRIVDGKGLKEREVPLNATARRALLIYFKTRGKIKLKAPVFLTRKGVPPTVRAIQLMVSNLARKAKIKKKNITPHTLRHTFALNYLKANPGSLIELAALLGHDSISTTAIYTKASKEKLAEDVERTEINIYDD